jgi:multiple sugar transport system substrate-binding protein
MSRRGLPRLAALASVAALAIAACGNGNITPAPSVAPTTLPSASPTAAPSASPTADPCTPGLQPTPGGKSSSGRIIQVGEKPHTLVRWFVGLGPGEDPPQIALLQTVVSNFNALQDKRTDGVEPILLSLEIVQHDTAVDILRNEIGTCNAPDLIGPMDIGARAGFPGEFVDLTPLIAAAGFGLSQYPANLLDAMKDGRTGALLGLPYGVIPSVIFYNKDLFDRAGLKYPPQKAGDPYTMPDGSKVPWNWDTVRAVAMKLSLDTNGKNATQAGFDPTKQAQFGFEFQAADGLAVAKAFGSGSFLGSDGKTAQFPDAWKAAWTWYYDGIWNDHFIASDSELGSVAPGGSDPVMFCCHWSGAHAANDKLKRWDIAVMPANAQGVINAPLDIETFAIDRNTTVAQRAFEAMTYVMTRSDLLAMFGASPYSGDQIAFYHANVDPQLAQQPPGNKVNWQVAIDMERFADIDNHATDIPNYARARDDYSRVFSTLATTEGLNMDMLFSAVTVELQADFDAAP